MKALLSLVIGVAFAGALVAFGIGDEMRLGELRGVVTMSENDKVLPGASVVLRRRVEPGASYEHVKTIKTNGDGKFDFGRMPVGSYSVEAFAKAHSADESVFSVREGDATELTIDAKPGTPYLRVFAAKHVFLPKAEPELTIEGFGQDPNLDITLYKVNFNKVVAGGGLQSLLQTAWRWDDGIKTEDPSAFSQLEKEIRPIERRDLEGAYVETVNLDALPSGMYWVSARAGKSLRSGTYILVSDIAMVTKKVGHTVHAYITHMNSGKAQPGAQVAIYHQGNQIATAKSDANGFAKMQVPEGADNPLAVVAVLGSERAVIPLYLYGSDSNRRTAAIFTDRPVYRPGHTVNFKGIVRSVQGPGYAVPAGVPVDIKVYDADSVVIKELKTQTSEFGGFAGAFDINPEAATGSFVIEANLAGSTASHWVQVAAYRKPEFQVSVTGDKPYFVRGDRINGSVQVDYYFGGAVPEAKVDILVYRRPHYGEYEMYFSDYEGGDSGEYIGEINAVTDGQGKAKFSWDTSSIRDPENDYVYTFEASVTDSSGRTFDGRGSVKVTRGEFEVSAFSQDYVVEQGEEATIEIETKSFEGNPIDAELSIVFGIETWGGNEAKLERIGTTRTESKGGKATVTAKATRAGYMVFEVRATDSRGNVILSRPGVYVPGQGDFSFGSSASLSVKMDKREYKVGDAAQAVVIAPVSGDAWFTVEGNGIYVTRRVSLTSGGNLVDFKVDERMLPNSYVTVQFVNSATYYEGSAELSVDLTTRKMDVVITPDKKNYQPGDTAVFRIKSTDAASKRPVSTDLAFGLVDESIYAIRPDNVNLVEEFYPVRYSNVETNYSFPEIYLGDGDKDVKEFDVRRRFLDTAHWDASVVTDANGEATVSVDLPDNLTTWRATARGLSNDDSLAGQGIAKVVAAKPLMVRLGLPRFFVQGDEVEITATVNSSADAMDATVSLDAIGVELVDSPRRAVKVSPQSPQTVRWRVKATKGGSADFKVMAVSGEPNVTDAMETSVPVIAMGRLVAGNDVGDTSGSRALKMAVDGYLEGSGELEIVVASDLVGTLRGSLDYLVGYPYGCVEQTLSRFLPSLVISKSPLAAALSPEIRSQLPDMVAQGFSRLRSMQHSDGGWGWWEADDGDPRLTGLALEGYALAAGAGMPPEPESRSRGIEWARGWLAGEGNRAPNMLMNRLTLLRGLAAVGDHETVARELATIHLDPSMTSSDLASLVLAAKRAGIADLTQKCVAMLKAKATVSASHAIWKEEWWGTRTTGEAIFALATVSPTDPIVTKGVRYLFDKRKGDHWGNTWDTAVAVLAITKTMAASASTGGLKLVKLVAGGKEIDSGPVSMGNSQTFNVDMDDLDGQVPTLQVEGGTVFFAANWRYRVNDEWVKQGITGKGLSVTRAYYRLKPRRLDTGELRLLPSGNPLGWVGAGETVRAVVKINSEADREFMMLEDPLPSGFEVLERSSDGIEEWEWFHWFSGTDIRDDRIVFFMRYLSKGESVLEYTLRAEAPGSTTALPAVLSNMYDPDETASTPATKLEVRK